MPRSQDHAPAGRPLADGEADRVASVMAAFSAASRVKVLFALYGADRTVEEVAAVSGLSAGLVSQQLRVLRLHRLVVGDREGRHVRYRLADDHVAELLAAVRAHSDHADAGHASAAPAEASA